MVEKKKKQISGKAVLTALAALAGAMLVLRIYQVLRLTDFSTGFFTDSADKTVIPYYVLFVLFVPAALLLVKFSDIELKPSFVGGKDNIHAVACLIMSASFVVEFYLSFSGLLETAKASDLSLIDYVRFNKAYSDFFEILFAGLSVLLFAVSAVSFFAGRPNAAKLRLLHLSPVMWAFTVTVQYFSITASYLKEPQFMLLIFSTAFFMIFLFEYARFVSGIGSKTSAKIFLGTGIVTVVFLLLLEIPLLLAALTVNDFEGIDNAPFSVWQPAALVFVISAIRLRLGTDSATASGDVTEEIAEALDEAEANGASEQGEGAGAESAADGDLQED